VSGPETLSAAELTAWDDPAALLERAWALEPPMRVAERREALDRLEALIAAGLPAPPRGRSWALELLAERALDAAISTAATSTAGLEAAVALADRVLREAEPTHRLALARATLARGRALGWLGTDDATDQADRVLAEAATRFAALDRADWQGFATFWRGFAVHFQNGRLPRAAELMREALEMLAPDSARRATVLVFYADVLTELGDLDDADRALDEAFTLAANDGDRKSQAFTSWSRATVAAARGDPLLTERLLREVERDPGDWFETTHIGAAFLTEAAERLDQVGLTDQAAHYLARAVERVGESDESVLQAQAMMLARSGDPWRALDALQELARGDWLEKRFIWRFTLLRAWATFRAGGGAGELAARAIEQAVACGGVQVAQAGEPVITAALAPPAERAGSVAARELLLAGRELIVRLFGTPELTAADGAVIRLPAGMPGELVRLLALHEHGLPVDVVLETFFPDTAPATARQRLRQVLTRLRTAAGEIVIRDGETLRLIPAWVDVREFLVVGNRVRGAMGTRAVQLAYAALALHSGPLLPSDPYAAWAEETRTRVRYRHLALLDLVAADAVARGSHQEALTALEAALAEDPEDEDRRAAVAEQMEAVGRRRTTR
jgi:DNA-binding SARP family transcriptional activator/tetratricopeptide (TPR) repeat protein